MLISQLTKLSGLLAILLCASFVVGSMKPYYQEVDNLENAIEVYGLEDLKKGKALKGDKGAVGWARLKDGQLQFTCSKHAGTFNVKITWFLSRSTHEEEHNVHTLRPTLVAIPSSTPKSVGLFVTQVKRGDEPDNKRGASGSRGPFQPVSDEDFEAAFGRHRN